MRNLSIRAKANIWKETEGISIKAEPDIREAAKVFARLGASKGGHARAQVLTQEERREIARQAVMTRWAKRQEKEDSEKIPRATHGSPDRPHLLRDPGHV